MVLRLEWFPRGQPVARLVTSRRRSRAGLPLGVLGAAAEAGDESSGDEEAEQSDERAGALVTQRVKGETPEERKLRKAAVKEARKVCSCSVPSRYCAQPCVVCCAWSC